ncbi:MAG: carboxypeptidase-like regulatory domain-containing protein, partial [Candidatus Sulfotelmatobacter sp.]
MTFRSTAMSAGHTMTLAIRIALLIFVLSALSLTAVAQSTAGRVLGRVTDQSGASVAGAKVVITDVQRGTSRTLATDTSGDYVAPDLIPGTYKIHVEAKGFKAVERPAVTVEVATDVRADFSLQPGDVSEIVTVTEEVPLINTTSSTLGGTLSNVEINDLPLNGRNYENLLQLRPGVVRYPGGGFSTTSADGLRAEDNAYYVEGLFNSEPYSGQAIINGSGIAGDSATILPIDAIQEFNLQQNPPAEYGWKPGAVVNVGLKSGTNKLHGTAFGFGRDGDHLDARNYFNDSPSPKLTRTLEQFGGSLGGAIIKDRAFFFGAYEGQRYNVGNSYGGVTGPSMVHMAVPSTGPNCSFGFAGDCADSIPDALADITEPAAVAAGVIVSPASLLVSGCSATGTCNGTGFVTNNQTDIGTALTANQAITIPNGFNNVV